MRRNFLFNQITAKAVVALFAATVYSIAGFAAEPSTKNQEQQLKQASSSSSSKDANSTVASFQNDVEFEGLCVMGLAEGKRIKTDCSVSTVFEEKTYCFRTEDAKLEFNRDPKRNLERAKDHYAAGAVSTTADDMGHYSVEDVKAYLELLIKDSSKANNGVYLLNDAFSGENLPLVFEKIDFMRTLHGYGFFPEVIFSHQSDRDKKYLVDFWVRPKAGKLNLFDVRIYKAPKKVDDKWTLVKRLPKPWWWIPASEHPGESEQKRSWEVISAIEQHIVEKRTLDKGIYKLKDDKTGEEVSLEFVGVHQPVRKLKENGKFFACTDFRKQGTKDQYYDIDFWLDELSGNVTVGSVRLHKVPELRDGEMIQVKRYENDPTKTELVP